jgi:hypothetical protein
MSSQYNFKGILAILSQAITSAGGTPQVTYENNFKGIVQALEQLNTAIGSGGAITSVFGRTGVVIAVSGDYTTDQVTEGSALFFTNARARFALSASSPLSYNNTTGAFTIQQSSGSQSGFLSGTDWTTFNGKQSALGYTPLNTASNLSDLASVSTARSNLSLVPGTNVQTQSARLQEIVDAFAAASNGQVLRKNTGGTGIEYATVPDWANPGTIGSTTPNTGVFTTVGFAATAGAPTFTSRSAGTKVIIYPTVSPSSVDYAIGVQSNYQWFSVPTAGTGAGFKWYGGVTEIANLEADGHLTISGSLSASGSLTGASLTINSTRPISWGSSGANPPTFTSSSAGTKVIIYPAVSPSSVDYAIGIESSNQWFSVPTNSSSYGFKWYGGTTQVARISGSGELTLAGSTASTSTSTGTLTLTGSSSGIGLTGSINAAGYLAGKSFKFSNSDFNILIGEGAMPSFTPGVGQNNAAIGYQALYSNTDGVNNAAIGYQALYSNTNGVSNAALGYQTLYSNVDGTRNAAVGNYALYSNVSGQYNTAIGRYALYNMLGSSSVGIGHNAGYNETASNRLYIANAVTTNGYALIYGEFDNNLVRLGRQTAVNAVDVTGASTGNAPTIAAMGTDTNVNLSLSGKGTGRVVVNALQYSALSTAPASASATGTTGEVRIDANYVYVCTATNTWKRAALSTW